MKPSTFHVIFKTQHYDRYEVKFDLIDHPIIPIWARLLEGYILQDAHILEQTNERFRTIRMSEVVALMNDLVDPLKDAFGDFFDEEFYSIMLQDEINRDELNILHDGYEKVQDMMLSRTTARTPEERVNAQSLNEFVHRLEMFIQGDGFREELGPRPRIRTRQINFEDHTSAIIKLPFHKEDFSIFRPKCDGALFLNYCQVGKSPLSVYKDDDDHAEEPVPWEVFGPAFWFSFFNHRESADFDKARAWLKENTGRDDWVLGDPCIGKMQGSPIEIWAELFPDPQITEMFFTYT